MSTDLYQARVSAPQPARPLVLALHGTGGDENQLFELTGQLVLAAGVVSLRADVSEGGAARFYKRSGAGLYDMVGLRR